MNRKLSDLLDQYPADALELEMNTPLSSKRIKELTMEKVKKAPTKRRIGFKLLLVAAVIAALTMTVFAAEELMTYDNWLEGFFSGKEVVADISASQLALLDQSMAKVNQSVTCDGYTVTLETAMTDGYVAYLTFRVTAPEGRTMDKRYLFKEVPLELLETEADSQVNIRSGGWSMLDDGNDQDNSILLLLQMDSDAVIPALTDGTEKTISLTALLEEVEQAAPYERIAEGEWTFHFTFGDCSGVAEEVEMLTASVRCEGRRMLGQKFFDVSVKMTSFRLRPLTATCVFEEPLTGYWDGISLKPIYVVLKDGTRILAHYRTGVNVGDGMKCTFEFDVPISLAEVDYVEFAGGDRAYMPQTEE